MWRIIMPYKTYKISAASKYARMNMDKMMNEIMMIEGIKRLSSPLDD